MTSDEFAQMMLLDCCFVIEIIDLWKTYKGTEAEHNPITSTRYTLPVVVRDMLMLENQLPFFLLETLFHSAFPKSPDRLENWIFKFVSNLVKSKIENSPNIGDVKVHHILHLLHYCIDPSKTRDGEDNHPTPLLKWIPSATQLMEAGVHFRKKEEATNFLDITFQNGEMEIPLLQVDDDTNILFRNLLVFEQCSKNVSLHVTAYATLMDCIINTAADVALLQQHGIILSCLGDGKQVANLFNQLCKEVTLDYEKCYVSGIYKDVNDHCDTKYNQWRARLNHDYFSNPWAVISLFAAILLFVLTITQTIYSALSYNIRIFLYSIVLANPASNFECVNRSRITPAVLMSNAEEKIEIITSEEWLSSLKKRVDETKWMDSRTDGPTIFKVPRIFQEADPKAYKPRMVSLGPYHHGKIHLKAMEDLKWHYLKKFLGRNPGMSLEDYIEQIKKAEDKARMAYSEKVDMTSDEFVQMMLLDCCFVIEIIDLSKTFHNPITSTRYTLPVVVRDMLMLENQLPFFLLETLFHSAFPKSPDRLENWIFKFVSNLVKSKIENPPNIGIKKIHHILHLWHYYIDPYKKRDGDNHPTPLLKWIPSATQLMEAGVHFKKKEATNFLDITFQNGEMGIPLLQVDDDTETFLRNLIAFEQCSKNVSLHVTAYAALMDCIINTAADVALLQQHGIILSCLGDGKQVANLFNKLCKEVTLDYDKSYVSGIYKDVNDHWTNQCNQWRARLNHDYFSNPWAVISVFAAILLFVLTITQTIYSALSYVRPPN
ncbi:unnamed protein product [Musa acuminata subsp. burmannicoides]